MGSRLASPPAYLRVEGRRGDGRPGWIVRNHIDSDPIKRAIAEGWRATACGWHHCVVVATEAAP